MTDESSRVFFALWPDDALRAVLAALAREVARETGGRPPAESNVHLTLAFLGEQPAHRVDALLQLGSSVGGMRFALSLDEIGCFPRSGVAWLGAGTPQPDLQALQTNLALALRHDGFPVDERPYTPHLTLARRIRAPVHRRLLKPIVWEATSFALVASELGGNAPTYRTLAGWPLASK
jgi:2'-5' RNA ligase